MGFDLMASSFAGVFMAQLLIWLCQFLIKKYLEPHVEKGHKKIKSFSKKVVRRVKKQGHL